MRDTLYTTEYRPLRSRIISVADCGNGCPRPLGSLSVALGSAMRASASIIVARVKLMRAFTGQGCTKRDAHLASMSLLEIRRTFFGGVDGLLASDLGTKGALCVREFLPSLSLLLPPPPPPPGLSIPLHALTAPRRNADAELFDISLTWAGSRRSFSDSLAVENESASAWMPASLKRAVNNNSSLAN